MIFFWSWSSENLVLSEHDLILAVVKYDDTSESIENGISEDGILPASEGIEHKNYLTFKSKKSPPHMLLQRWVVTCFLESRLMDTDIKTSLSIYYKKEKKFS